MAKESKSGTKSQLQSGKTAYWKKLVVMAIIIGLPLLLWAGGEFNYQMHASRLSSAIDEFGQNSLKRAGGIAQVGPAASANCRHWLDTLNPAVGPCPGVSADWFVLIKQGQESAFISDALSKAGYTANVTPQSEYKAGYPFQAGHGTKQGLNMGLTLNPLGSQKPPYDAPAESNWLQLSISIEDANAK